VSAAREARRRSSGRVDYDVPDSFANLDEIASVSPVQNPDEAPVYRHESLELVRSREQEYERERRRRLLAGEVEPGSSPGRPGETEKPTAKILVSRLATNIYTVSYLVFFAILGTLARLGLQVLTTYPGAPVIFSSVWPNFAGSLVMGFLSEDRMLFRPDWGSADQGKTQPSSSRDEESGLGSDLDPAAAKKAHNALKKTIPLYIGLATGFCGSFTSFSSFIRDIFLAASNDLVSAPSRNGGDSFMAVCAVLITTVSLSISGLFLGAHAAIALEPFTPALPQLFTSKVLDRLAILLGLGCWMGAVILSVIPPDSSPSSPWRAVTFSLVFAPLGCLTRFTMSLWLNGKRASFPLGTFAVNVIGSAVLAMSWDLAHGLDGGGGIIGCQLLQGIEDGFCGCLTTVSTWVAELASLQRRNAYIYGITSVMISFALMIAIMGGLRWSVGFGALVCNH
jgi:fluoride ion exporter CrcB/FEX